MWLTQKKLEAKLKVEYERGLALGYFAALNLTKERGGIIGKSKLEREVKDILRRQHFD